VQVGTPIIRIGDSAETSPAPAEASPAPAEASPVPAEASPVPAEASPVQTETSPVQAETSPVQAEGSPVQTEAPDSEPDEADKPLTLVGYGSKEDVLVRRTRTVAAPTTAAGAEVLAKPNARKLARDLGVDLATVAPERADGVITTADLDALPTASETAAPAGVPAVASSGGLERREPIKGLRRTMGQAMVDSAFTLPHVTIWTTLDMTATTELVARLRARREFADVRVSPLLIVAKACLLAMRRTPIINSWWDDAAQEIVFKEYVNLGIAAATPRGLQVPNVKGADRMSLAELGGAINELTATARTGKTPPADQAGGTFTITNIGPFGIDGGAPIINPGESAILSLGAVARKPWVVGDGDDERIEPRDVCTIALSFDHRHIDGEAGSRYLSDVAAVLADPATALMF
ncbi:MAG: dihydrolipoamide acetyltransferase family protein, partial [Nocardioides sp.]|uniref:dihydrolipoamide acetyltransferase family protein n=1 Tax=Nocardioides sp. TaxID=35761 RepID=UPI003D6A3CEB